MKTIGLIGGMSWESTAHYYAILNHETAKALGGLHSAPVIVHSVDFAPIEALHPNKKSTVSQREVGRDTRSFAAAIRFA